ncbi:MAG TPA: T9SS type A sorting domain-containing protein [bacterium]|jgi:hypothetical protein
MKHFLTVLFVALVLSTAAVAQITIHNTDFSPVGGGYTMGLSNDTSATVSVGQSGANRTWTFDAAIWNDVYRYTFLSPADAPHGSDFPNATRVMHVVSADTDSYDYESITATSYSLLGSGLGDSITNYMTADQIMPLPFTYPASWVSLRRFQMHYSDTTLAMFTDSAVCTADAWGTVTTPYGTWQSIRCFSHHYMTVTITIGGFTVPVISYQYLNYTWVDQHANPVMAFTSPPNSINPNFTHGYMTMAGVPLATDPTQGSVAQNFSVSQNYPNPFNPVTLIPVTLDKSSLVALDIFDELGQLVSHEEHMLTAGRQQLAVNGSRWANGMYFARVTAGAQQRVLKMNLLK